MMPEEIRHRLADQEDNYVERKPARVNRRDIRRTVVAFANSVAEGREAVLFIGVQNNGIIEGCPNPDDLQMTVRAVCEQECYPAITFRSEVIAVDGAFVVAVVIPASKSRPHFSGPAYVRRGSESVAASEQMFDELIYARTSTAAAVLRIKNEIVDVVALGHKLGEFRRIDDRHYREGGEARILECTAQSVRFQLIASGRYVTEPLDHVRVLYNEEKHRHAVIVTGY